MARQPGQPARAPIRLAVVLGVVLAGCAGRSGETAELRAAIEPHLAEIAEYDRWARRVGLADPAFRSEAALEEAAFAPLRRSSRVRAAWLTREGPDPRDLRHPRDAPSLPGAWSRVQSQLGPLDVQRTLLELAGQERAYLVVRRTGPAPGDAVLHVTLAFDAE